MSEAAHVDRAVRSQALEWAVKLGHQHVIDPAPTSVVEAAEEFRAFLAGEVDGQCDGEDVGPKQLGRLFEVGDRVVITGDTARTGHMFGAGTCGRVIGFFKDDYDVETKNGHARIVGEADLKPNEGRLTPIFVGDTVQVTGNDTEVHHYHRIGETVEVVMGPDETGILRTVDGTGIRQWVHRDDVELVPEDDGGPDGSDPEPIREGDEVRALSGKAVADAGRSRGEVVDVARDSLPYPVSVRWDSCKETFLYRHDELEVIGR